MKKMSFDCPHCQAFQTLSVGSETATVEFKCGSCSQTLKLSGLTQNPISICPFCENHELHQHKDFNKVLGFAIFALGAILVPWTYALSLLVALAIDAALFPFFPWMQVCYNCRSEMRGWPKNPALDRFSHETAAHYEYGKSKKSIQGVA